MSKRYHIRCDGCREYLDANGSPYGAGVFKTQKAARAALGMHGGAAACLRFTGKGVLTDDCWRDIKEVSA